MKQNCLVGYTGFVGAHLGEQATFQAVFNSANIAEINRGEFDMLVCAAAPGSMFEANRFPYQDQSKIEKLIDALSKIKVDTFVLISSIAVLADFAGGNDEQTREFQQALAYGRHRRMLEAFIEDCFAHSLIVRLPALFGHGLRKNFIFDLLNPIPTLVTEAKLADLSAAMDRQLFERLSGLYCPDPVTGILKLDRLALDADPEGANLEDAVVALGFSASQFHNPETTYQYYNINRLWSDIDVALQAGLSHIHLVSEPLTAARIHHRLTGHKMPESNAPLHREDMRTRHAELWSQRGPYLDGAETVLNQLEEFYASERGTP